MHRKDAASNWRNEKASDYADNSSHEQIIEKHVRLPILDLEVGSKS